MEKIFIGLAFVVCYSTQSCNQANNDGPKKDIEQINKQAPLYSHQLPPEGGSSITKEYDLAKIENYYPFIIYKDNSYMIAAEIESEVLFDKYNPIFEKYGYSGNGYSWEGHIKQMLQKEKSIIAATFIL